MAEIGKISPKVKKAANGALLGLVGAFILLFSIGGCGHTAHLGGSTDTEVHIRDSVVLNIKDSTVIHEATHFKDFAWMGDTLNIEGQRSRMWAAVDTTKEALVGGLEEDEVKEKTKIEYRDRIQYRDSIQIKEVPVPVEVPVVKYKVPWIFRILSLIGLLSIVGFGIKLYLKFKKPIG